MNNKRSNIAKSTIQLLKQIWVRRNFKDHLFIRLFREKEDLLTLYNALNSTNYSDTSLLTINTLEDAVYLGYKNDVSFIIGSYINLYEHQSTYCPNMPLRGLFYLSSLYQGYVTLNSLNMYGTSQLSLPTPRYVVFYNGTEEHDDVEQLYLSDSFADKAGACLECVTTVYNINFGHNEVLLKQCSTLEGYSVFISKIREFQSQGYKLRTATELAIDYCIEHNFLKEFLLKQRAEVTHMILTEYNPKKQRQMDMRDAHEEGRQEGRQEGRKEERQETLRLFLKNGGSKELAKTLLNATDEELDSIENEKE